MAAGLAATLRSSGLRVGVVKPVETGWRDTPDPEEAGDVYRGILLHLQSLGFDTSVSSSGGGVGIGFDFSIAWPWTCPSPATRSSALQFSYDWRRSCAENASELQQFLQKSDGKTPVYRVIDERGPDHNKEFEVQALVGKRKLGIGKGKNKKEAEQSAACDSLHSLGVPFDGPLD